ncbi:MAG: peptidylprolyl isomerase [Flavobacteriales bacterium]|nr:peptidylprolyl isomerase [Flavobacteriales bacterium]MCX7650418.1 peptidylprolyl isomerase [Flavobacteriales bacterium]MDW8431690.1 peptidylprolyl isomerase [Flavobacteriales bacterium]
MQTIQKGVVVTLSYTLRENDAQGVIIQETTQENPLVFLFGAGQLLPEFEHNIAGKSQGDEYAFGILAENAYGLYDPEGLVDLPIEIFMEDGRLAEDLLVPGRTLRLQDDAGHVHSAIVKGRGLDTVQVDFNHPLAGKNLYFTGQILSVRQATPDELAHGHVHGPGGVHH